MASKLTGQQQRRVDELRAFTAVVDRVKRLVAELDSSRAAKLTIIENLCRSIEKELRQLRQRALTTQVGTLADTAGALAIIAARAGGGIQMKIRGLQEGVNSMTMQLDQALKQAQHPGEQKSRD